MSLPVLTTRGRSPLLNETKKTRCGRSRKWRWVTQRAEHVAEPVRRRFSWNYLQPERTVSRTSRLRRSCRCHGGAERELKPRSNESGWDGGQGRAGDSPPGDKLPEPEQKVSPARRPEQHHPDIGRRKVSGDRGGSGVLPDNRHLGEDEQTRYGDCQGARGSRQ